MGGKNTLACIVHLCKDTLRCSITLQRKVNEKISLVLRDAFLNGVMREKSGSEERDSVGVKCDMVAWGRGETYISSCII